MRLPRVLLSLLLVLAPGLPASPLGGAESLDADLIRIARVGPGSLDPPPSVPAAARGRSGDPTPVAWGDCPTSSRVVRDGLLLVATRAYVFEDPRGELLQLEVVRADAGSAGPAEVEVELVPVSPPASRDLTRVRRAARPGDPSVTARILVEGALRVKIRVDVDGKPFPVLFELASDPPHCHR